MIIAIVSDKLKTVCGEGKSKMAERYENNRLVMA